MKVLGLIGGVSWPSTVDYYSQINEGINKKLGKLNFSKCIISSFNFQEVANFIGKNDWESVTQMTIDASKNMEKSGAECILLCSNTMHVVCDRLEKEINIPIIHIATTTAMEIEKVNLKKIALLGTKFTMKDDFFTSKLQEFGIETIVPKSASDIQFINDTIFNELAKGEIKSETKQRYLSIIDQLKDNGAEGIIAGCTEIPMLITSKDIDLPYFDTVKIHAKYAVEFSLEK